MQSEIKKVACRDGLELSSIVTTKQAYTVGKENALFRVAALDVGIKKSILTNLADRGCDVKVFPAKTSFAELEKFNPNGYFISNGPGDPGVMDYVVDTVKQILEADKPLFGICLGNQLLARALDIPTYKLHHDDLGGNHHVNNLKAERAEITTHNNHFAIDIDALKKSSKPKLTHVNPNDDTVAALKPNGKRANSVQNPPQAAP